MLAHTPFGSSSFKIVAKGLVELHQLIAAGQDDSSEAEAVRDALDAPLKALNATEKIRAQWLSEDLYSISESSPGAVDPINPLDNYLLNEADQAIKNGYLDRALELLRQLNKHVSPSLLSYHRGAIWEKAGNYDVATAFFKHASECAPEQVTYQAKYTHALETSDPASAWEIAQAVLNDAENRSPILVAQAGHICFNKTRIASYAESAKLCRTLVPILQHNMGRLEQDQHTAGHDSAYCLTVYLLGLCHEFLGHSSDAETVYSRGLQVKPDDDRLLVARGSLLYGTSPLAITDLEQATRLGSPLVWPYLFLAHHYLETRHFKKCQKMCETGLNKTASATTKSQLHEWRAISLAELGASEELIRAAFEESVRMDPSNEIAKRNQAAFEALLSGQHSRPRSEWEQESAAAVRQIGLIERRYTFAA